MDADLRSAVSMSHLRELPVAVLDELLVGSTRLKVPVGSVTHWEGELDPHLELVQSPCLGLRQRLALRLSGLVYRP
jgi:hypothetical protein